MTAITPLPPAPLVSDDTPTFNSKAFALAFALGDFVTEANTQADEVNAAASSANDMAVAAAASEEAAAGAANFRGAWSSLTGALAIPASASHLSSVWILTQNVADVTAEVPGTSSKWVLAGLKTGKSLAMSSFFGG